MVSLKEHYYPLLLFNLYIDEALKKLHERSGADGLVLAYADNILVAGDPKQLKEWEETINSWGVKWNLWVEWKKCQLGDTSRR